MNKKIITIIVAAVVVTGIGVGAVWLLNKDNSQENTTGSNTSQNQASDNQETTPPAANVTIASALDSLRNAGMTVSDDTGAYYQMIGAENGSKHDVDGVTVELYEFNDQETLTTAQDQLESDTSTVFSVDEMLVVVHSVDAGVVDGIQGAIEN